MSTVEALRECERLHTITLSKLVAQGADEASIDAQRRVLSGIREQLTEAGKAKNAGKK